VCQTLAHRLVISFSLGWYDNGCRTRICRDAKIGHDKKKYIYQGGLMNKVNGLIERLIALGAVAKDLTLLVLAICLLKVFIQM
jgi:hypothetical protein